MTESEYGWVSPVLYFTYVLLTICLILAIVMPLLNAVKNPKGMVKSAIGLGFILVLFLIGYSLSGDEVLASYGDFVKTPTGSKLVGGSLAMMYFMLIALVITILYSELSRLFK
jgi:hypothetical protein